MRNDKPEIINSDKGSQFTSPACINLLEEKRIEISMDGKGRAKVSRLIERFWKKLKHNHIYLNLCDTGMELFEGVKWYIDYYNQKTHQTIKTTPKKAFDQSIRNQAA